jgi:hypothetical protein
VGWGVRGARSCVGCPLHTRRRPYPRTACGVEVPDDAGAPQGVAVGGGRGLRKWNGGDAQRGRQRVRKRCRARNNRRGPGERAPVLPRRPPAGPPAGPALWRDTPRPINAPARGAPPPQARERTVRWRTTWRPRTLCPRMSPHSTAPRRWRRAAFCSPASAWATCLRAKRAKGRGVRGCVSSSGRSPRRDFKSLQFAAQGDACAVSTHTPANHTGGGKGAGCGTYSAVSDGGQGEGENVVSAD